jgi:uncharacterized membrane protein YcaP (DUF421 family)
METREIVLTALRTGLVYFALLAIIRLLGKRSVGAFSAFDLLVAMMLGEASDEVIYGDVSIAQGLTVFFAIALLEFAVEWLSSRYRGWEKLFEGAPTVIVRRGEIQEEGVREERMSPQDVFAQLRLNGIQDLREVEWAVVETNGQVSVLLKDWAETAQRSDVSEEEAERKREDTGGREEPPPEKRTTDPL